MQDSKTQHRAKRDGIHVYILYLSGHDFAIDATDVDASIEASLVVSIHDVPTERLVGTSTAVVWSLSSDIDTHRNLSAITAFSHICAQIKPSRRQHLK